MSNNELLYGKKCPHCGFVYDANLSGVRNAKDNAVRFGKIYVTCPQCKQTFRDEDICELAIMDPPKGYLSKFSDYAAAAVVFVLMGVVFGGMYIYKGDSSMALVIGIAMAFCAIFYLCKECDRYSEHLKTVRDERWRSIQRIKGDPEYARMLKADGFRLPDGIEVSDPPSEPSISTETKDAPQETKVSAGEGGIQANRPVQRADFRRVDLPSDGEASHSQEKAPSEIGTMELNAAIRKRQFMRYYLPSKDDFRKKIGITLLSGPCVFVIFLYGAQEMGFMLLCGYFAIFMLILATPVFVLFLRTYIKVKSRVREIEESGELEHVLNDFSNAREAVEDRFRIGKEFLYSKSLDAMVVDYNDIDRLEASLRGGSRVLSAHLKSRRRRSFLCNLRDVDDADIQRLIRTLCEKNPAIRIE